MILRLIQEHPFRDAEFGENLANVSKQIRRKRRWRIQVPETQSAFHRRAQRNAFHYRDAPHQSRSFARRNQSLRRPNSNRLCRDYRFLLFIRSAEEKRLISQRRAKLWGCCHARLHLSDRLVD